jgi:hypothetical protein
VQLGRRQFLSVLAVLGPVHFLHSSASANDAAGSKNSGAAYSVRRLGQAYLRQRPEEAGRTLLLRELRRDLDSIDTADDLKKVIRLRISDDFAAGRTVMLDGWVLSITECRLCALQIAA